METAVLPAASFVNGKRFPVSIRPLEPVILIANRERARVPIRLLNPTRSIQRVIPDHRDAVRIAAILVLLYLNVAVDLDIGGIAAGAAS